MRALHASAQAKVNLTLEVLGRRADGYHELASVMATVDLADDVRVAAARTLDVRIHPPVGAARGDDLASRAVRALAAACGREPAVHVRIRKRIPVAAGLGGGSSDAGAVIRAVARLWGESAIDLVGIAAQVGSDVPFFAAGHAVARVGGRGEQVRALPPPAAPIWIVLVTSPLRLATRDVFAALEVARGDGRATADLAGAFERGSVDAATIRSLLRNDLTAAAERIAPEVAEARAAAGARGIDLHLSGSGPSLFAVADDRARAIHTAKALRRLGLRARPYRLAV
jgi:4-diphosphocytidyl-2-C-methyl-D-erythritol kinase